MKTHPSRQTPCEKKPSVTQRLGLGAFSISLLVHAVFVLVAVLFLYRWVYPEEEVKFRAPGGDGHGSRGEKVARIQTTRHQTMAAATSRKIASTAINGLTLPETSPAMMDSALPVNMSLPTGAGNGTGPGIGNRLGNGAGTAPIHGIGIGPLGGEDFMTPFGSNVAVEGSMPGRFYDFKQTKDGKPTKDYEISRYMDFASRVVEIQDAGFRDSAFRKFFQAPDTLFLTQIAIPLSDADSGPRVFNVAEKVKPSGWFVHYQGKVAVNRDIHFRFVGVGDDYLSVHSKGRPRLIATWASSSNVITGKWEPSETSAPGEPTPLHGSPPVEGDWIHLKKGQWLDLDIGIGECPGGKVGFVLMVEEKGVDYRTSANGAKVLPIFTTQPITPTARERITQDFKNWDFEWDNVPVFTVEKVSGMASDLR